MHESAVKEKGYIADPTVIATIDSTLTKEDVTAKLGEPNSIAYSTNTIEYKYTYYTSQDNYITADLIVKINTTTNHVTSINTKTY